MWANTGVGRYLLYYSIPNGMGLQLRHGQIERKRRRTLIVLSEARKSNIADYLVGTIRISRYKYPIDRNYLLA